MNSMDKLRFGNLLAEAGHAADIGDEKQSSTILCEAMLILHKSIKGSKTPIHPPSAMVSA